MDADYICDECGVGRLQPAYATFARMHRGQLLTVPNFPVWRCDVCRAQDADHEALRQLADSLAVPVATLVDSDPATGPVYRQPPYSYRWLHRRTGRA